MLFMIKLLLVFLYLLYCLLLLLQFMMWSEKPIVKAEWTCFFFFQLSCIAFCYTAAIVSGETEIFSSSMTDFVQCDCWMPVTAVDGLGVLTIYTKACYLWCFRSVTLHCNCTEVCWDDNLLGNRIKISKQCHGFTKAKYIFRTCFVTAFWTTCLNGSG